MTDYLPTVMLKCWGDELYNSLFEDTSYLCRLFVNTIRYHISDQIYSLTDSLQEVILW